MAGKAYPAKAPNGAPKKAAPKKAPMTQKRDDMLDKRAGIKEGSPRDNALDKKRGLPPQFKKKSK